MNVIIVSLMSFIPYVFVLFVISLLLDWVFVAFTKGKLGGSSR